MVKIAGFEIAWSKIAGFTIVEFEMIGCEIYSRV